MGCDIHLYVEKKVNGKWEAIEGPNWLHDYRFDGKVVLTDEPPTTLRNWLYHGRNYDLFAILADVRNGRGFAGCVTGEGFNPIAQPRGLPSDVSPKVQSESDQYGIDGHSHSYFTLAELLAYNWEQTTKHSGWVSPKEYTNRNQWGRPESWCGGVSGRSVVHVSEADMKERLAADRFDSGKSYYCQVEWEEAYYDSCPGFVNEAIPKLKELAEGKPNDVRIVFFFDN